MKSRLAVLTIAALIAAPAVAGDIAKGKEKSAPCAACHGADGNSQSDAFPRIGGQHEDYILHSLRGYKAGKRKNAIMAPFAAQLKPEEIKEVAEYFARQKPTLLTVPTKEKVLTAAK